MSGFKGTPCEMRNMKQETPHAPRALGDDRDRPANVLGEDVGEQWLSVGLDHHPCPDAAVGCAETSVLLTNAYFVPGPQLRPRSRPQSAAVST